MTLEKCGIVGPEANLFYDYLPFTYPLIGWLTSLLLLLLKCTEKRQFINITSWSHNLQASCMSEGWTPHFSCFETLFGLFRSHPQCSGCRRHHWWSFPPVQCYYGLSFSGTALDYCPSPNFSRSCFWKDLYRFPDLVQKTSGTTLRREL